MTDAGMPRRAPARLRRVQRGKLGARCPVLVILAVIWLVSFVSPAAPQIVEPSGLAAQLVVEAQRDPDLSRYPQFQRHIINLLRRKAVEVSAVELNPYVADLLGGDRWPSVRVTLADLREFFEAAAQDELTILRAMAFVARTVRRTGVLVYLSGEEARRAVDDLDLDIGLALPMEGLELFAYIPVDAPENDEIQSRFVAVYSRSYEHRFAKEVLDATLRIGTGRTAPFLNPWQDDASIQTGYIVEGSIAYGPSGIGFVDVKGISGRKHGVLGALQRVFFFLPDAIHAMVIQDGSLVVEAILNQRVPDFERKLKYAVHRRRASFIGPPNERHVEGDRR